MRLFLPAMETDARRRRWKIPSGPRFAANLIDLSSVLLGIPMIATGLIAVLAPFGMGLKGDTRELFVGCLALFACFLMLFVLVYGAAWYSSQLRAIHPEEEGERPPGSLDTFSEKVGEPALRLMAIYSGGCVVAGLLRLVVVQLWSDFLHWVLPWSGLGAAAFVVLRVLEKRTARRQGGL